MFILIVQYATNGLTVTPTCVNIVDVCIPCVSGEHIVSVMCKKSTCTCISFGHESRAL